MFDVVGVGANSVDYVYRLPEFPAPDGPAAKLRIRHHAISPGGQTATTLCTCAAMGLEPTYIGAVGNDDNGELLRDELTNRSVDTSHLAIRDSNNAFAVILLHDAHGERVVLWDRTSELDLEPEEIDPEVIRSARLIHVDDVDEGAAILAASIGREAGLPVTSDIERVGSRTGELLAAVSIPIFAEHVLEQLTGEKDFERGLRKIQAQREGAARAVTAREAGRDMVCVTLGSRGAMLLAGDRIYRVSGIPVDVVDSTGAGDVFRGAFITALLRGDGPQEILRFANLAAALSCTRPGAIGGIPTLAEIQALL
jgi:sugar/nucleoside kinase (ribokinase family)